MLKKIININIPWLIAFGFFGLWELVCWYFQIDKVILPSPIDIAQSLIHYWQPLVFNSLDTLMETLIGFVLAVLLGVSLGLLVGVLPQVYKGIYPLMVALNSIPKVAVVPVLVIWVGIGTVPAIITAFITAFFPIMINMATGLATTDPEMSDVLRALGASKFQTLIKVSLPNSMPYFFASLKVAITLAFIGSIVSETIASDSGIGYLMMSASSRFEVSLVFAGLFMVGFMGVTMYQLFAFIERRITYWATRS